MEAWLSSAAAYSKHPEVIDELIRLGADTTRINAQGKTALDLAREKKNSVAEAALLRYARR